MTLTMLIGCTLVLTTPIGAHAQTGAAQPLSIAPTAPSAQVTAPKFDPARDPAKDVQEAIIEAKRSNRRIILDVGGEWCSWCHTIDNFYATHADLMALREKNFVWVKVNYSPQNENKLFLATYPAIKGYPHLFVLEKDGTLLFSEDTSLLEEGPSYNLTKMFAFLQTWVPKVK